MIQNCKMRQQIASFGVKINFKRCHLATLWNILIQIGKMGRETASFGVDLNSKRCQLMADCDIFSQINDFC